MTKIVRNFLEAIANSSNQEDAIANVFYGENGIDMAFQKEKISWKDHQLLLAIIEKMA